MRDDEMLRLLRDIRDSLLRIESSDVFTHPAAFQNNCPSCNLPLTAVTGPHKCDGKLLVHRVHRAAGPVAPKE